MWWGSHLPMCYCGLFFFLFWADFPTCSPEWIRNIPRIFCCLTHVSLPQEAHRKKMRKNRRAFKPIWQSLSVKYLWVLRIVLALHKVERVMHRRTEKRPWEHMTLSVSPRTFVPAGCTKGILAVEIQMAPFFFQELGGPIRFLAFVTQYCNRFVISCAKETKVGRDCRSCAPGRGIAGEIKMKRPILSFGGGCSVCVYKCVCVCVCGVWKCWTKRKVVE